MPEKYLELTPRSIGADTETSIVEVAKGIVTRKGGWV